MNTIEIVIVSTLPLRQSRKSGAPRHIPYTVSPLDNWRFGSTNPLSNLRGHATDAKAKEVFLRNNK